MLRNGFSLFDLDLFSGVSVAPRKGLNLILFTSLHNCATVMERQVAVKVGYFLFYLLCPFAIPKCLFPSPSKISFPRFNKSFHSFPRKRFYYLLN